MLYIFFVWNALCYYGISCYIFSACGMRSGIVKFCVIFLYDIGTRSVIVELSAIFFCVLNALWYCISLCHIFLRVEHVLVLRNFVFKYMK